MSKIHGILPPLCLALVGFLGCSSDSTTPMQQATAGSAGTAPVSMAGAGTGGMMTGTSGSAGSIAAAGSTAAGSGGLAAAGSAGADTGGAGGATAGAGGADMGGAAGMGMGGAQGDPGADLNDLVFAVPCDDENASGSSCNVGNQEDRAFMETIMFGGDPGTTYNVTLHFCGPFEGRQYDDCQAGEPTGDNICIDGEPPFDGVPSYIPTYPTLSMDVSAPAHTYYLNADFQNDQINEIDYSATFEIQGGATIVFESDGGSNGGIYTAFMKDITCPDVPGIDDQPYAGQFIHVTLESVAPAP